MRLDRGFVVVEISIEQREIEVLAEARALAIQQRRAYRAACMRAGAYIAHRSHRKVRRTVGLTAHRGDSGIRGAEKIEAGLMRERSGLAECGNRAHHNFGIELLGVRVVESHPSY